MFFVMDLVSAEIMLGKGFRMRAHAIICIYVAKVWEPTLVGTDWQFPKIE